MPDTILTSTVGSVLHGINTPESDVDQKWVYVHPALDLVSPFRAYSKTMELQQDVGYELLHFVQLLLKGNPTILEVLWSPLVTQSNELGEELRNIRHAFLDAKAIHAAHLGYAMSQRKKIQRSITDWFVVLHGYERSDQERLAHNARIGKHYGAWIRVLRQGIGLLYDQDFDPRLAGWHKQLLLELKQNPSPALISKAEHIISQEEQMLERAAANASFVPDKTTIELYLRKAYSV